MHHLSWLNASFSLTVFLECTLESYKIHTTRSTTNGYRNTSSEILRFLMEELHWPQSKRLFTVDRNSEEKQKKHILKSEEKFWWNSFLLAMWAFSAHSTTASHVTSDQTQTNFCTIPSLPSEIRTWKEFINTSIQIVSPPENQVLLPRDSKFQKSLETNKTPTNQKKPKKPKPRTIVTNTNWVLYIKVIFSPH